MISSPIQDVLDFQSRFNRSYLSVPQHVSPGRFEPLLRPFRWWEDGHRFEGLEQTLRAATAHFGAALAKRVAEAGNPRDARELHRAVKFLSSYQEGELELVVDSDPLEELRSAARNARKLVPDRGSLLEGAAGELLSFHADWEGIVLPEVLALDSAAIFDAVLASCKALIQTKNTTYNVVRNCGDEHLAFLAANLETLLPADQVHLLHGLDAFPNSEPVAAFLRAYAARTPHTGVREYADLYAGRVEAGQETSGFEP